MTMFCQREETGDVVGRMHLDERSEEVADIIERMPTGWTGIVTTITFSIVMVMTLLGFVIEYPDTVTGQISITGEKAPVRIVSHSSGRLHLLVENGKDVETGTCLGYIETGASYEDIMRLDSICGEAMSMDTRMVLPHGLELGALSPYYNDFVLAYLQYDQLRETKVYENMRKTLRNQQRADMRVSENMQRERALNNVVLSNVRERYELDSVLHEIGALSDESLMQQYNGLLSCRQTNIELESAGLIKESEISSVDIELAKVDVSVNEETTSSFSTLVAKHNILANQIRQWKELYLLVAPVSGLLQYMGFWRDNVHVDAATELFSISPAKNRMIGELFIPSYGAGKVEVGQDVNVKLNDYPYDEYGYVRGKVETLSTLTRDMETPEGSVNAYLVTVSFPDGLRTNYGKRLHPNFESAGTGEVITERRRLIQRLFDNIKSKEAK